MDPLLKYCLVMPLTLAWALVSIHGARKGWQCFVNPPVSLEYLSSHAVLKALFGPEVIKNAAVTTGWISLGVAFYVMYYL